MPPLSYCFFRGALGLGGAAVLLATSGCGDDGPARYDVHGPVTFDGEPVPAGTILFTPIPPNQGPGGSATIQGGRYDSAAAGGLSPTGGPHRATLHGYDGVADPGNELPFGRPTFGPYTIELDLPQERSEQPIDVPAEAKVKPAGTSGTA